MGYKVNLIDAPEPMAEVHERLCLTEDGRLVDESSSDARWLYCVPGNKVPLSEAIKYGLVAPEPEPEPEPQPKQQKPRANKMRAPTGDK